MTKRRFGKPLALGAVIAAAFAVPAALAQQAAPAPQAGKLINAGDVLSGELNALRVRGGKKGKRLNTFQLVTNSDAQAAQLKGFIGKQVSLKIDEVACAQEAGQMSEAVVTKWSVVTKH